MAQNTAKAKGTTGIMGAGIGGLALAAMLTQRGFKVRLFEQAHAFSRLGAGLQMAPNPCAVLRGIGLEPALRDVAFAPHSLLNRDFDTGRVTNEVICDEAFAARYGVPYLVMHRADLHRLLGSKVPREIIEFGRKLEAVDQDSNGVHLTFTDGSTADVDWLVACDGVHSVIRKTLLGDEEPRYSGRIAYRAVFPAHLLGDDQINLSRTKYWGPDRHIVIYYVTAARDEVYFVTSQPEDPKWLTRESWSTKGDMAQLREDFAAFHAPFDATHHGVSNHLVTVDGDVAHALSYGSWRLIRHAAVKTDEAGPLWDGTGWYDDELVRTHLGWRIRKRVCRLLWSTGNPKVKDILPGPVFEDSLRREARAGRLGFLAALDKTGGR